MVQANQSDQPTPEKPPRVRLVKGQEVGLGCGSLILIAIIVALFSSKADLDPVRSKLIDIDFRLQRLEEKLDQLNKKANP